MGRTGGRRGEGMESSRVSDLYIHYVSIHHRRCSQECLGEGILRSEGGQRPSARMGFLRREQRLPGSPVSASRGSGERCKLIHTRSSAIAVIADRTACSIGYNNYCKKNKNKKPIAILLVPCVEYRSSMLAMAIPDVDIGNFGGEEFEGSGSVWGVEICAVVFL